MSGKNLVLELKYYATFQERKCESLFCKINTFLQKRTTTKFSVNI